MGDVTQDMQTPFLQQLVDSRIEVFVFLVNGIKLRGELIAFDTFSLALQAAGSTQTIFKSAVSTVCDASAAPIRTGATSERSSYEAQRSPSMLETNGKYRRRIRSE
ncbi:RNA chaperone Hfq [Caballeronia zhejiangensis]|uniref:RNA chaperone Hfq n=1 Tax=Caballeronia zhejiangensis TaxID=871203 RepID=UPI001FD3D68F|nr:RNA chaperone Hfq [Caballeronia zhejiangensis]